MPRLTKLEEVLFPMTEHPVTELVKPKPAPTENSVISPAVADGELFAPN
jgi:hypothetical protein